MLVIIQANFKHDFHNQIQAWLNPFLSTMNAATDANQFIILNY